MNNCYRNTNFTRLQRIQHCFDTGIVTDEFKDEVATNLRNYAFANGKSVEDVTNSINLLLDELLNESNEILESIADIRDKLYEN